MLLLVGFGFTGGRNDTVSRLVGANNHSPLYPSQSGGSAYKTCETPHYLTPRERVHWGDIRYAAIFRARCAFSSNTLGTTWSRIWMFWKSASQLSGCMNG